MISQRSKEFENLLIDMFDKILSKEKLPFVYAGAGISIPSDLPLWTDFVSKFVLTALDQGIDTEIIGRIFNTSKNSTFMLDVAGLNIEPKRKEEILAKSLWGENGQEIKPSPLHYLLVSYAHLFDVPIFTTNYDTLLEDAASFLKLKPAVVFDSLDAKEKFSIVYLHGRISREGKASGKIIASRQDYLAAFNSEDKLLTYFKDLLSSNSCLFVGTSLVDDNILRCISAASTSSNPHYWFCDTTFEDIVQKKLHSDFWNKLKVNPIYCRTDGFSELTQLFRRICNYKTRVFSTLTPATRTAYQDTQSHLQKLLSDEFVKRCIGDGDECEIDLYVEDGSDLEKIRMVRICSTGLGFDELSKKSKKDTYKFEVSLDPTLLDNNPANSSFSIVKESMDTLDVHLWTRGGSIQGGPDDIETWKWAQSWSYIVFPIFRFEFLRAPSIVVLKYKNHTNKVRLEYEKNACYSPAFRKKIVKAWRLIEKSFITRVKLNEL